MKTSFTLSKLLPTVLATLALVGCSHVGRKPSPSPTPSPRAPGRSAIRAEDIARSSALSIEELLMARVPGLTIIRAPDGRTVMQLRGVTSLNGDGEPLFVVNGLALGSASSLGAISRFDIESIEVLKDPASTAAWGMRGSNGVIVIKTKGS
jgi:TonB-dependent SusC/RagA subfamily outer membrane receptor